MTKRPDSPESWYQQHKQHTQTPSSIKQRLMAQARRERQGTMFIPLRQWATAAAGGLALIALIGVWQMSSLSQQPVVTTVSLVDVEMHGFDKAASPPTLSAAFKAKRTRYFAHYTQRESNLALRHQRQAEVILTEDNGPLVLLTCSDTIIQISDSLVNELMLQHRFPASLKQGEPVVVDINQDGYILAIKKQEPGLRCDLG